MSEPIKVGEIVNVTIKGVRTTGDQGPRDTTTIADEHGTHYVMPPQAKIERVAPALWPPCEGDLWRDGYKRLWLACTVDGSDEIRMVCAANGETQPPEHLLLTGSVELVHHEPDRPPF